jgi:Ni2+-binding GTPase involved in maturation of urease and hydrogenase
LALQLEKPREMTVEKPVRIVLVGGFLGAGKTTALGALAREFIRRGRTVGVITNDQAENLADSAILRKLDLPVGEVAGGCFCCRFTDLLDAARAIFERQEPDLLLCEPVGSCADMAATVLNPLKLFYRNVFSFAPFTVLADPRRLTEALETGDSPFAEEAVYIFRKQLEEADLLAVNKTDLLTPQAADRLARLLAERYGSPVLEVSALNGDGIEAWADRLLEDAPAGTRLLREIDYDVYAQGEAVLGWLNATVRLTGAPDFEGADYLRSLLAAIREDCRRQGAEIAHLKATLREGGNLLRAHVTSMENEPFVGGEACGRSRNAELILNARVQTSPERLRKSAEDAVFETALAAGAKAEILMLQSFSPSYPKPPYRLTEPVA